MGARFTVHTLKGPKRRSFYGTTRKEASDNRLAAMGKPDAPTSNATVAEWLGSWLASAGSGISPHTHERYSQVVKHDLIPALGAIKVRSLTPAQVEDFRDAMLPRASPTTVKYALGTLSTAMGKAAWRGMKTANPVSKVRRLRERRET